MFIVSVTYKCPIEKVEEHLEAHIEFLKQEYANGIFVASGRKVPRTGGIILATAENVEKLNAVLVQDPFYKFEIADYDITEFIPTMTIENLEILKKL